MKFKERILNWGSFSKMPKHDEILLLNSTDPGDFISVYDEIVCQNNDY